MIYTKEFYDDLVRKLEQIENRFNVALALEKPIQGFPDPSVKVISNVPREVWPSFAEAMRELNFVYLRGQGRFGYVPPLV